MRPKSNGSGNMVSDFIDEKNGYLKLTQEEYEEVKRNDLSINMNACQQIEYGGAKEGYWTSERFMQQIKEAVKIVEVKYSKDEG